MSLVGWILVGLVLAVVLGGIVAWLKGTLSMVGATFRELGRHAGEPWTWAAFFEPALTVPVVFVSAALGLAHPDSPWARWFYRDRRTSDAPDRHGE
jgi:hypothetical protein